MREALAALRPGELAGPLEVGPALYLFELAGIRTVPFEDVREELRRELLAARPTSIEVAAWIAERMRAIEVRPLPALFD